MSITTKAKVLGVLFVFLLGAYLGIKLGSTTQVIEKEVKGETVTIVKDRIVTVTRTVYPDGTVTESTKTEEKDKSKKKKETKKESGTVVVYKVPKYSLGYTLRPKWDLLSGSAISHGVTAGYNLGYNLWLKAGAIPSDNIYTLGVEFQF
jgi:hypothetical protein